MPEKHTFETAKTQLEKSAYSSFFELLEYDDKDYRYGRSLYRDKEYGDTFYAIHRKLLQGHYPDSLRGKTEIKLKTFEKQSISLKEKYPHLTLIKYTDANSAGSLFYNSQTNEFFEGRFSKVITNPNPGGEITKKQNRDRGNKIGSKKRQETIERKKEKDPQWQEKVNEKRKKTTREIYGVDYITQTPGMIEKSRQTNLEVRGVTSPAKCPEVREKMKKTCLENFGYETNLLVPGFKEHISKVCKERYSVDWPSQASFVKDKIKKVFKERFKDGHPARDPAVRNKTINTNLEKYGTKAPAQNEEVLNKQKNTFIKKGAYAVGGKLLQDVADVKDISKTVIMNLKKKNLSDQQILDYKKYTSHLELIIINLLEELGVSKDQIIHNKQYFKNCNIRPDIVIPNHKLIIECDGLIWHSDHPKFGKTDIKYHKKRREFYLSHGYTSLFFRQNEILEKLPIVRSIIMSKLNLLDKIPARKCEIRKVGFNESIIFAQDNHLMGNFGFNNKGYGLYYENELVSFINYNNINKDNGLNILRFCNKTGVVVVGGLSRLIQYITNIENPDYIESHVDLRYGNGSSLEKLNFSVVTNYLSFKWTDGVSVWPRRNFLRTGYELGYYKIYDCGQIKYTKRLK